MPDFRLEQEAMTRGASRVAGVDEVGRGPLAGPVVAAAVILDPELIPEGLDDSKKLSAKKRQMLAGIIRQTAQVSIGQASVDEIDYNNILQASLLAMTRAVQGLEIQPDYLLIDGNQTPKGLRMPMQTVVKGDTLSQSIAAASIVAKIWRDQLMVDLAQQHPGYGWETNMGYGSKSHMSALQKYGPTPHHRRSFKPVHNMLYQDKNLTD
jgi:ribonuclease HII